VKSFKPLVSIIINTHNSVQYLREAIQSAINQTYSNVELLVYDNASTVDINRIIDEFDYPIRYYRSDLFLTLGQARNEALKLSEGEFIDFLDADDLFQSDKLEKQVPFFQEPKVGLVYSNSFLLKERNGNWEQKLRHGSTLPEGKIFSDLLQHNFISFDAAIFRKEAIGEDPREWFNEQFNICTDYDLFLRISYFYEIRYIDEGLSQWRDHGANWSVVKGYLTPVEKLMMIPRILKYAPDMFQLHSKGSKKYLASIYNDQMNFYWKSGLKKESILCGLHSLSHSLRGRTFIKFIMVPFISFEKFSRMKTAWRK